MLCYATMYMLCYVTFLSYVIHHALLYHICACYVVFSSCLLTLQQSLFLIDFLAIIQQTFFVFRINSSLALINEDFLLCGEVMAMSILQNGTAPNFMTTPIVHFLIGKPLLVQDIKDPKLKTAADQVSFQDINKCLIHCMCKLKWIKLMMLLISLHFIVN
jgi:hypothetical protein